MKRSVAILGPTPQFMRWAIWHPCPLRELDGANLPDDTFRQLRGVREFSTGLIENRVFEGVCIHPDATSDRPDNALGFAGSEIIDAYGNEAFVANNCRQCPANALNEQRPGIWAGCYGWLAATSDFCFETAWKPTTAHDELNAIPAADHLPLDFVELVDETINELEKTTQTDKLFMKTSPRWYGIWNQSILNGSRVVLLSEVFDRMVSNCWPADVPAPSRLTDLVSLRDALQRCSDHNLNLHVELIPPGYSDGQTWTLAAHCPDCKSEMHADLQKTGCPACGRPGNPHGVRKSKVLGLRPYVQLKGIMGESRTAEFLKRYEAHR